MKYLFQLSYYKISAFFVCVFLSTFLYGQKIIPDYPDGKWRGIYSMSVGYPAFHGFAIGMDYSFNKNNNRYLLMMNFNTQVGNRERDGLGFQVFANDKFYEIALLYGRSFQKNRFLFSIDAGPGAYFYRDKSFRYHEGFFSGYGTTIHDYSGVGLSLQVGASHIVSSRFNLGLKCNANINTDYNNLALQGTVGFVF